MMFSQHASPKMDTVQTLLGLLAPRPSGRPVVGNEYPIILVHGFGGWGRDEGLLLTYWGCLQGDIQEHLKAQGYTVYTAAVGPFSSNWDRACELYAQIKGGTVDYGANHANAHGHARYGRTFPGLYPEWGDVVDGKVNKVHLIGHSMGGQTIRMLAQLLSKGSEGAPVDESTSTHPLFTGGKDWVHSITTISTPNQGTLLADGFSEAGNLVKNAMVTVFSALGLTGTIVDAYHDVKLDQWGIQPKQDGESFTAYVTRVFNSSIFQPGFRDISLWSLSTPGAAEENMWVETLPAIYYFSYVNVDTCPYRDDWLQDLQRPNSLTMMLALQPLAHFLGGQYCIKQGFSSEWQANDGVVPTISMATDAIGESVEFDGVPRRGKWNRMPILHLDHLAVIGHSLHSSIMPLYDLHARIVRELPEAESTESTGIALPPRSVILALEAFTAATHRVDSKRDLVLRYATTFQHLTLRICKNTIRALQDRQAEDQAREAT